MPPVRRFRLEYHTGGRHPIVGGSGHPGEEGDPDRHDEHRAEEPIGSHRIAL